MLCRRRSSSIAPHHLQARELYQHWLIPTSLSKQNRNHEQSRHQSALSKFTSIGLQHWPILTLPSGNSRTCRERLIQLALSDSRALANPQVSIRKHLEPLANLRSIGNLQFKSMSKYPNAPIHRCRGEQINHFDNQWPRLRCKYAQHGREFMGCGTRREFLVPCV